MSRLIQFAAVAEIRDINPMFSVETLIDNHEIIFIDIFGLLEGEVTKKATNKADQYRNGMQDLRGKSRIV